jgi:hypothetical protein
VRARNFQADYNTVEVRFGNGGYANLFADVAARAASAEARRAAVVPIPPKQLKR